MTNQQEPWKNVLASIETAILSVLAFPFVLPAAIGGLRKALRVAATIREGKVTCGYCNAENPLNLMTRCACGAVEPGSRLRCTFCGTTYDVIPCLGCGATLRVL
jgi:hypothetical protein